MGLAPGLQKLDAEGYEHSHRLSERSEPPQAEVNSARVARLKFEPFSLEIYERQIVVTVRRRYAAGSLRSSRYARLATLARASGSDNFCSPGLHLP